MDCRSLAAEHGFRSRFSPGPAINDPRPPGVRHQRNWTPFLGCLLLLICCCCLGHWPAAAAMRPDRVRELRRETVDMFYHGFDNYMNIAFPEDEVWFYLLPTPDQTANPPTLASSGVLHSALSGRQEPAERRA
jgi:hypothetical protein